MRSLPLPPLEIARRSGSPTLEDYELIGRAVRDEIVRLLPPDWSPAGKRCLDFGCGSGRVLRHFLTDDAPGIELVGCDIYQGAIDWLRAHLCPPLRAFCNDEAPPLPLPSRSFDLVWATSVFTHITDHWAGWLLELHRLLKDDGLLVATFINEGFAAEVGESPWSDERIGMNVLAYGHPWDGGGPVVLHSLWWINEHWGRAFEIVEIRRSGFAGRGQGVVLLRKKPVSLSVCDLERVRPDDEREIAALRHNIVQLHRESQRHRDALALSEQRVAEGAAARAAYEASLSWRVTRPLRALGSIVG
jgi:SAM-dependent methyltransferase